MGIRMRNEENVKDACREYGGREKAIMRTS